MMEPTIQFKDLPPLRMWAWHLKIGRTLDDELCQDWCCQNEGLGCQ